MRISDWSSDVCSSDLLHAFRRPFVREQLGESANARFRRGIARHANAALKGEHRGNVDDLAAAARDHMTAHALAEEEERLEIGVHHRVPVGLRSEEHPSELQSLMRTSYAVFCLKKKTHIK